MYVKLMVNWLEIWSNHFCPSMGLNGGSVATDSEEHRQTDRQTGEGMGRKGRVDDAQTTEGTRQKDRGATEGLRVEGTRGF
jgi:hypothetical protein